jgi:hypothetical protein
LAGGDAVVVAGEDLGDLRAYRDAKFGALGGWTDDAGGAHGDINFHEWQGDKRGGNG